MTFFLLSGDLVSYQSNLCNFINSVLGILGKNNDMCSKIYLAISGINWNLLITTGILFSFLIHREQWCM